MGNTQVFHSTRFGLQRALFDIPAKKKPEPIVVDPQRERALEGLPHYWRMSWGHADNIIEKCGYPVYAYVSNLEDPNYKHRKQCPLEGKHNHDPYWEKYPTGWSSSE